MKQTELGELKGGGGSSKQTEILKFDEGTDLEDDVEGMEVDDEEGGDVGDDVSMDEGSDELACDESESGKEGGSEGYQPSKDGEGSS